jgi:hypothetical protein
VVFKHVYQNKEEDNTLPYVSWRKSLKIKYFDENEKKEKFKKKNPILAIGWEKYIEFLSISLKNNIVEILPISKFNLENIIIGLGN